MCIFSNSPNTKNSHDLTSPHKCYFKLFQLITCILLVLCALPKITYLTHSWLAVSTPKAFFDDDKNGHAVYENSWDIYRTCVNTPVIPSSSAFPQIEMWVKEVSRLRSVLVSNCCEITNSSVLMSLWAGSKNATLSQTTHTQTEAFLI